MIVDIYCAWRLMGVKKISSDFQNRHKFTFMRLLCAYRVVPGGGVRELL